MLCRECGDEIQAAPDSSEGVWVHCDTIAEDGRDIDANHAAVPETEEDLCGCPNPHMHRPGCRVPDFRP